jgi:hypothetical protein
MNERQKLALHDWRKLNELLPTLTEAEVAEMLEHERGRKRRLSFVQRLHQRVSNMRVTRERLQYLAECESV